MCETTDSKFNEEIRGVGECVDEDLIDGGILSKLFNEPDLGEPVMEEDFKELVLDRVHAVTMRMPMMVGRQEVKAVVDTGAEVTVISEEVFNNIPEERRPELRRTPCTLVVAEAGKKMTTHGLADVEFTVGLETFTWSVYVAPIRDAVLLGCDVIDEKDLSISTKRGIEINGKWINCEITRAQNYISRLVVDETVTIPSMSEVVIAGRSENVEWIDTRYSTLEPVAEDSRKIMIVRSLIDPFKKKVPVRILNLEKFPVKLRKNYLLGELHPVLNFEEAFDKSDDPWDYGINMLKQGLSQEVEHVLPVDIKVQRTVESVSVENPRDPEKWKDWCLEDELDQKEKAEIPQVPAHLLDLFNRSCINVTDEMCKGFAQEEEIYLRERKKERKKLQC